MRILLTLITFFGLYLTQSSDALASIKIENTTTEVEFSKEVLIAHAPTDFAIQNFNQLNFVENVNSSLKLGYRNDQSYLRFKIENNLDIAVQYFIYFNTISGTLKLYDINDTQNKVELIGFGGTDTPIKKRYNQSINGAIPITLKGLETKDLILELNSRHNISSNLYLGNEESLAKLEKSKTSILNFYIGGILSLVIYNLFLYLLLKDKVYIYYGFYALAFMATSLVINGRFDQIIQLENYTFAHYLICFSSLALLTATLFTQTILEINRYFPSAVKLFKGYIWFSIIIFIFGTTSLNDKYPVIFGISIDLAITIALISFIYVGLKLYKRVPVAKFYLVSWICVLLSVVTWFGMTFGILPINIVTQNALPLGSLLEMLTLAFTLAYKIEVLNKEKITALEKARDKEKYERLVRVLSHDVANSLTVVSSYSKKLMHLKNLEPSAQAWSEKIFNGAQNIKNILQIVREQETAVSKKTGFNLQIINIKECVEFSKVLYEELLQSKNIQLKINIPESLSIKADKTCFINNIMNNIISNSIKFSYSNSAIEIYSTDSSDFTIIIIKDYGIGIRDDLIHDIFFTNKIISSIGTNSELGYGLGTNLLREYMSLFEGKIQVTSSTKDDNSEVHGTTIKLIFPHQSSL